ncbi:arylesterase [Pokkaliibacter sp. CJK22405]|uniref:arylesterase n=1 Tax=Pokkaliibacter sp. CJK22405 TaxID=3384615 RepID=UPI003984769F
MLAVICLGTVYVTQASANTLVVLGDSLSAAHGIAKEEGWVSLLTPRLEKTGWQVINASISGDTSDGGVSRLPSLLERHHPQAVLIELGGNDGLRGLPPQRFKQNLQKLIEMSRAAGATPLLLGIRLPPNYGPAYTQAFENSYQEISNTLNTPLLGFFIRDVALQPELMQSDGLHPNAKGQPLIADRVGNWLEPQLSEIPQEMGPKQD